MTSPERPYEMAEPAGNINETAPDLLGALANFLLAEELDNEAARTELRNLTHKHPELHQMTAISHKVGETSGKRKVLDGLAKILVRYETGTIGVCEEPLAGTSETDDTTDQ
jgi:hypothetical protein